MSYVTFYLNDPNAPKPNMPAHLGSNCIITCKGKLLLERRVDSDTWGLVGGGCKKYEEPDQAMAREVYEELGWRIPRNQFRKLKVYGAPGRIAAFKDGSIWRMVIVVSLWISRRSVPFGSVRNPKKPASLQRKRFASFRLL